MENILINISIGYKLVGLFFGLLMIASAWNIFTKAKKPGWASIIPIYNVVIWLKIIDQPLWWIVLLFLPIVDAIILLIMLFELGKSFGKSASWNVLFLILFPIIGLPLLAFDKSQYQNGQEDEDKESSKSESNLSPQKEIRTPAQSNYISLPFFNTGAVFGLDIGFETLKLVQLKKSKSQISLVGAVEIPLMERILERDHFKNKAETANMIKEACRKAIPKEISAKKIVTAIPETFVFSKTIQLPKMKDDEYARAVPIEANRYLPIPVEDTYLDYQVLIVHPDEPLVDILLVATPKKLVDDYVEMTNMAGLELIALEPKSMAVGRAISQSYELNGTVVVEIGTELSRISIWDNGNLRLTTTANTGKNQITETLSHFKNKKKIESDNLEAEILVEGIANEVINAIKYHQNRDYKPAPIQRLLLCGTGAKIEGIKEIFERETRLVTEKVVPKLVGKSILGTEFITSFGLALRNEID